MNRKIIVLDDDPTGVQTVHGVYVYTNWEEETILEAFLDSRPMFFILTNSRSFSADTTRQVHRSIARRIEKAARETGQDYLLVSRGDSTLRGHFPLETETLRQEIKSLTGKDFDGELICPFFPEGGRYTIDNIHYVKDGDSLIPVGESEFAKDNTFGFQASNLCEYVEEKTMGRYPRESCICISTRELKAADRLGIKEKLLAARDFQKIILNADSYDDLRFFKEIFMEVLAEGKRFLARSAAAWPKVLGDIRDTGLLTKEDLVSPDNPYGGLVIIGSHVQKTTRQLEELKQSAQKPVFLEFDAGSYAKAAGLHRERDRILALAEEHIRQGRTAVVYTSRQVLAPEHSSKEERLSISVAISEALTGIVRQLSVKPRFILAKGGITSSDVGTKGLGVDKALVLGQIRKGIPVWLTGPESRFPHTPYIIFPGNVGETADLREIVEELSKGLSDVK